MLAGTDYRGSPRVALGLKVLRSLPDKATCNFLLEWYFEKCHECAFHQPSVMATASSLWSTFGKQLKEPRRLDDLEEISAIICKNNETALPEHEDYQPWFESFTGMNLRWESLGSVFAALTTATLSLPERDAFFCSAYSAIPFYLFRIVSGAAASFEGLHHKRWPTNFSDCLNNWVSGLFRMFEKLGIQILQTV